MKTLTVDLEDTVYEDLRLIAGALTISLRQAVTNAIQQYYAREIPGIRKKTMAKPRVGMASDSGA